MKNRLHSFSFLLTLGVLFGVMTCGTSLLAQDPAPQTQQPEAQPSQQQPTQTPDQQTQPTPPAEHQPSGQAGQQPTDTQAQSDASGQTFTGTITKSGDKYVLQDAASGTTYDIDHQDEVKKFEGKKVKVHGTLDSTGKKILVQ
jgi:hypothetical protein